MGMINGVTIHKLLGQFVVVISVALLQSFTIDLQLHRPKQVRRHHRNQLQAIEYIEPYYWIINDVDDGRLLPVSRRITHDHPELSIDDDPG